MTDFATWHTKAMELAYQCESAAQDEMQAYAQNCGKTTMALRRVSSRTALSDHLRNVPTPDVDALAQHIRLIDGRNDMGAGRLAEAVAEWIRDAARAKGMP